MHSAADAHPTRTGAVAADATPASPSPWLGRRRALDRLVAAALSLLTAPVVAVIAVIIRRGDGHSPLITVPRVGRCGATFDMWKLRSMRVDTDDGRASGTPLTGAADSRITPTGRRLRALHLDELPQLWNVAMGDMALLGPRPEAPEFVDLDDEGWRRVLAVAPGMAGPTQLVVGDWERSVIEADREGGAYREVVVPVKVDVDRWYVEHATPALDLAVLGGLLRHLLPATAPDALVRRVERAVPSAVVARGVGA